MRKIDTETGEIYSILTTGLWAPMPIIAYRILSEAKEFSAQRLLMCLVSHLGKDSMEVWPSYTLITRETRLSRSSIRRALTVLEEMGFIWTSKRRVGRHLRNHYKILRETFEVSSLPENAKRWLKKDFRCMRCLVAANRWEFGTDKNGNKIHYGCGGTAFPIFRDSTANKDGL